MKYHVNELCIGCGLCVAVCPDVFSIGDNGTAVAIDSDVTGEVVSTAQEAKEGCPVGAIEEQ
jgi:ferredoxin